MTDHTPQTPKTTGTTPPESRNDPLGPPRNVPMRTPAEEAEARCIAMLDVAGRDLDHSYAKQILAGLPDEQIAEHNAAVRREIKVILQENARILSGANPDTIEKE